MARRRKTRMKLRRSSYSSPFKRKRNKSSGNGSGRKALMMQILGAGIYGAARQPIAGLVSPISDSPMLKGVLGNASDEVVLLGTAVLAKKFAGRMPLGTELANAAIITESARIGEMLRTGTLLTNNNGNGMSGQTVYQ